MRIKTQLTKSPLPKLALNLGAFVKLERAHGWLCNWESLGSKPPGVSAGSLGSGCVWLSGTLTVSCKAQQGEGQDTHSDTLKPEKPLHASKDLLSQTQGGY